MSEKNSIVIGFIDKIQKFTQNFEKISNYTPEIIALVLFPVLFFFFGYFHEPWYDEAQAWQIAKSASYHDILFYLPHYEGHPPLWHLILSIFAKNNFPYETTLLSVSFVFSYTATFFIILKSPFSRIIRVLLPYTYFLFYQNGIISRPYCMVMLAFCAIAIFYKKRHEKPITYSIALIFLALTHPYSFVISSFLALAWFLEAIKKKCFKFSKFYISCIILGICYVLIVSTIFPASDTIAANVKSENSIFIKILYTFFILPVDCFFSDVCDALEFHQFAFYELILNIPIGILIWGFIYFYSKNKDFILQTFLITYIPTALIITKYFSMQHIGVFAPYFIFIFWLIFQNKKETDNKNRKNNTINKLFTLFIAISLVTSLFWSIKSSVLDVFLRYYIGKEEAMFIKKYNLDKYNILVGWNYEHEYSTNLMGAGVLILPYFDKNIFYNFNDKDSKKQYAYSRLNTKKQIENEYKKWRNHGLPDVIVGDADYRAVYKDESNKQEYIVVYSNNDSVIKKGTVGRIRVLNILVEKELAKKLNLKEIEPRYIERCYDLRHLAKKITIKIMTAWEKSGKNK